MPELTLVETELADACIGERSGGRKMVVSSSDSQGRVVVRAFGGRTLEGLGSTDPERIHQDQPRHLAKRLIQPRYDSVCVPDDALSRAASKYNQRTLPWLIWLYGNAKPPIPISRARRDFDALKSGAPRAWKEALI